MDQQPRNLQAGSPGYSRLETRAPQKSGSAQSHLPNEDACEDPSFFVDWRYASSQADRAQGLSYGTQGVLDFVAVISVQPGWTRVFGNYWRLSVTAIAQTPDGYLWVGTYNGLARF